MKLRIQHRLFLVLLAASGLAVLSMFGIMQWSINRGFLQYVNTMENERLERLSESLQNAYTEHGGWDFLSRDPEHRLRLLLRRLTEGGDHEPWPRWRHEPMPPEPGLTPPPPPIRPWSCPPYRDRGFESRLVVLDAGRHPIVGAQAQTEPKDLLPLTAEGRLIGYLGLLPRQQLSDTRQLHFVEQQKMAMTLIGAAILLISALFSFLLASRLIRPIKALANSARLLTGGEFSARVEVTSADELGQLGRDFNTLALTLDKNEQSRRQWVADISHELRTPLAVLRGEIEAILDGVRPASAEAIRSLHAEVLHLNRLVDDLYQLSLSDIGGLTYRKEALDPVLVLQQAIDAFQAELSQRRLTLSLDLPPQPGGEIMADRQRLYQLFGNLLDNACKYTDPGGQVAIRVSRQGDSLLVQVEDSAPGVPAHEIDKLFERLYRVESSRNRSLGGAGLGLAICRNIVEAHGGSISAQASPLGGLWITVQLPGILE